MTRREFSLLLRKYQENRASDEESRIVEYWYSLLDSEPDELSEKDWQKFENRLWKKLQNQIFDSHSPIIVHFWQKQYFKIAIAASIILTSIFGFLYYDSIQNIAERISFKKEEDTKLHHVINSTQTIMLLTLEDGSKVKLKPLGEIRYPKHFSTENREVYLTGEAFFDVSENAKWPFLVYTGKIVTKVLGTSFKINAPKNSKDIEVAVKTGKVAVYELKYENSKLNNYKGNGVILKPNHRVTFLVENNTFITGLVENPTIQIEKIQKEIPSFSFDDTPLSEVLQKIEKAYEIDIEVENSLLNDCPLTANLNNKTLFSQLDIICAVIEGSYEIKGTTILISGKGCE